jgi:hypothetical protein
MAPGTAPGEDAGWWCRRCGQPVELLGGDADPLLRRAVHAATGDERGGPEGHLAAPADFEPPLWRAARELRAEFGGVFEVGARFGVLRADWADRPHGVAVPHYTAEGIGAEAAMRAKLRRALIAAGIDPPIGAEEATLP